MSISYNGIGQQVVTFPQDGCVEGMVCKLNADGIIVGCTAGERPCGKVIAVEDMYAAVVMEGFVSMPYSGIAPTCGWCKLSANGNGGLKVDSTGTTYLVVDVDEMANICVMKL